MRTILGLILSALAFYTLWFYFPDTFATLVSFIAAIFNFVRGIIEWLVTAIRDFMNSHGK